MPKAKPNERKPSAAEIAARSRVLQGSAKMAEQYGITDDFVRETVHVAELPTPPATEIVQTAQKRNEPQAKVAPEQILMMILGEEADELATRLERYGIPFTPNMKQDFVDHCFTLIALALQGQMVGGGAIGRR